MITVFTPTYNRKYTINKLYESLLAQTDKNFEWIVVDDGSTDDTEQYFDELMQKDNPFEIVYIKQINGGKHRAINKGVSLAKGNLFFIVDSDDYILDTAIEKLIEWELHLDSSKKWAGIAGARGYSETQAIGETGKSGEKYIDAKNTERKKYRLLGDKAEAYFTDILKKYPFPEFEGENFITEEVVWNAIACDGYYLRWYKDIIYIGEYLNDGLTKSGLAVYERNKQGVLYWAKIQLKAYRNSPKMKLGAVNRYYETVKSEKGLKEISKDLGVSRCCIFLAIAAAKLKRMILGKR